MTYQSFDTMIPTTVHYTGWSFDPRPLVHGRKWSEPIPPDWLRVRFTTNERATISKIDQWLASNIEGAWASYLVPSGFHQRIVVVAFAEAMDAVMFKLKGGETAWAEKADATC